MPHASELRVAVVGAGIVGASIAFHLAERGVRVSIYDSAEPAMAASRASFAWINARDKNPHGYHDLNRRSIDMWERFARRLGGDIGLRWGGELRWSATEAGANDLRERVRELQSWGYPIRELSGEEVAEMEPGLAPGELTAASFTEIDGQVDTGRVVAACLVAAAARGAELHSGSEITGLRLVPSPGGRSVVEAVETTAGDFTYDTVALAAGTGTTALAASAGIELPQLHSPGATVVTEPVAPVFSNVIAIHTARDLPPEHLMNIRQFESGAVMIHGGTHSGSIADSSNEDAEQLLSDAVRFLPALEGARIAEVRRALRPMPEDGHPVVGFSEAVPNLYFAVTHSGVTLAPLIGELAATEIVDGARIDLLAPYRVERFG